MELSLFDILTRKKLATILPGNKAFIQDVAYHTVENGRSIFIDLGHVNPTGAIRMRHFLASMRWNGINSQQ